jgi:hypothetical protein
MYKYIVEVARIMAEYSDCFQILWY